MSVTRMLPSHPGVDLRLASRRLCWWGGVRFTATAPSPTPWAGYLSLLGRGTGTLRGGDTCGPLGWGWIHRGHLCPTLAAWATGTTHMVVVVVRVVVTTVGAVITAGCTSIRRLMLVIWRPVLLTSWICSSYNIVRCPHATRVARGTVFLPVYGRMAQSLSVHTVVILGTNMSSGGSRTWRSIRWIRRRIHATVIVPMVRTTCLWISLPSTFTTTSTTFLCVTVRQLVDKVGAHLEPLWFTGTPNVSAGRRKSQWIMTLSICSTVLQP